MSPQLAAIVTWVFVLSLLYRDGRKAQRTMPGLWVPTVWMLILGSRSPANWFVSDTGPVTVEAYEEGSSLNQVIYLALIAIAYVVLWRRRTEWVKIFRNNRVLFAYFGYCLLSALWADYPFVSLKGSIKAIFGNVAMVAVILTDRDPVEAIKTLIRRCTFVLVPLSVLVVKYYPAIGRATHRYSDETSYNGVAVGSNGLATTCFICALLVVWSLIRKGSLTNKTDFGINALMLVMIVWLMQKADGATSLAALLMGAALLLMLRLDVFGRQVLSVGRNFGMVLIVMAPIVVINYSWLIDIAGLLFGRSETLWGRLEVWRRAIRLVTNPFVGMGYNSFWQGDRLEAMWSVYWWRPTQAHNGYVETYLNLGLVGVMLLAAVIFTACRKAARTGLPDELQYLKLAYLLPIVFYNLNEAAFRGLHVAWFTFLLFSIEARGPSAPLTLSRARTKRYGRTVTNTKIALPQ